jgi:hypothetical protein
MVGIAVLCALVTVLAGCTTIRNMSPTAREAKKKQVQLAQLQAACMRFADQYVGRVVEETGRFQRNVTDPELRVMVSNWTLSQANSAFTTASGDSPVVSALDLVTLAVLSRMVIEDTLMPRFPQESAPLLALHRYLEEQAWTLTDGFLTPSQTADFKSVLVEWRARNPNVQGVAFVHFLDFAQAIGRPAPGEVTKSGGLFSMLGLDPLAGLDPAVRQLEQTRLLAERMIFYLQRVPYVVNLQVDRISSEMFNRSEVRGMLADADRVSRSAERFAGVAESLPETLASEREALIDQMSSALVMQQQTLQPMLVELRQAMEAAGGTATSVDAVVRSIDAMMVRQQSVRAAGAQPGRPFDITEYTQAAAEFTRTANELQLLLTTLNTKTPGLSTAVGDAVGQGRSLVDHLAMRVAALIALLIGGTLAAALAYRFISVRIKA